MRKICVLELLTAKRIESFKHVRKEELSATIRSIWGNSEKGTIAIDVSKAIVTLTHNIIWRILASKKISGDEVSASDKALKDVVQDVSVALGEFNVGDFVPYLNYLDLQGIKRRLKKANKAFDAFAEKIIEDHLHQCMAAAVLGGHELAGTECLKTSSMIEI